MSRILVLTGSPRKNGNTNRLAAVFAKGAKENNEVEILSVPEMDIHPCAGCNTCFTREGNACFWRDGMDRIYDKLMNTDILVIASPVYFYGISAQLKAAIDRLHTPMRNRFPVRKLGLILVGAATLPELFDAILTQYRLILEFFGLEDAGTVLVRGAKGEGEVPEGSLSEAYEMGKRI